MARYYKSPLCLNCGRDKRFVGESLGSRFMAECSLWLNIKYCQECHMHRCKEPTVHVDYAETPPVTHHSTCEHRCTVAVQGEHPAVYRDFCERHWESYAFCHKPTCKAPKEAWRALCDRCHELAEATRLRGLNRERATAARLAKAAEPKHWDPYKYVRKQARLRKQNQRRFKL